MFHVDQLSATVEGRMLFEGVSFEVPAGERLAVVGPSGSGKTTLLRTLADLNSAMRGTVSLEGRTCENWAPPEYRRRVLYVHQRPAFVSNTVRQALARPFSFAASDSAFDERAARTALVAAGLEASVLESDVARLSEGERQRVGLVRAMLLSPSVYLLDEPTSALDSESETRIEAMLIKRGATVIFVTHREEQAVRWATQTLRLGAPHA